MKKELLGTLEKGKEYFYLTSRNITILFFLSLGLELFNWLPISLSSSLNLFFYITLIIDSLALGMFFKFEKERRWLKEKIKYALFFSLLLITILSVKEISQYIPLLSTLKVELISIGGVIGLFLVWQGDYCNKGKEFVKDKRNLGTYLIILSFIVVILVRFYMGPLNTGAYIDEFYHLFSGINILETGHPATVYSGQGFYTRGLYVSYPLAFLFVFLGKSIFVANLLPFFVGIGSVLIMYYLSRMITDKYTTSLMLIVTAFSPVLIFIHTYIREYVFIQFFSLLIAFAILKIREKIAEEEYNLRGLLKPKNLLLLVILTTSFLVPWFYANSANKIAVLAVFGTMSIFLVFEILYKSLDGPVKRIGVLSLFPLILIPVFFLRKELQVLAFGRVYLEGLSLTSNLFNQYLISFLGPFIILYIVGALLSIKEKNYEGMYISALFAIIYFNLEYFQINSSKFGVRAFTFSIPFFYLIAVKGIEPLFLKISNYLRGKISRSKLLSLLALLPLISLFIIGTYPSGFNFYDNPELPRPNKVSHGEVKYKDWGKATAYLKENVKEGDIVISIPAHGAEFYGPSPDYTLMASKYPYALRTRGYKDGELRYLMTDTPVINSTKELKDLFNYSKAVWIIFPGIKLRQWGSEEFETIVKRRTIQVEESENWKNMILLRSEGEK